MNHIFYRLLRQQWRLSLLVVLFYCIGCADSGSSQSVRLWTERAEFVPYADIYNAGQERYKVEIVYTPDLNEALRVNEGRYDLLVGNYLTNRRGFQYVRPVDHLLRRRIDRSLFYEHFLAVGRQNRQQRLLPVSFNLPAIMFSLSNEADYDFSIDLETLRETAAQFNSRSANQFSHLGFSPRWSSDFLYLGVLMQGVSFVEDRSGNPTWDNLVLEKALNYFRSWSEAINAGTNSEDRFNQRYLQSPPHLLIQQQRIGHHYVDSERFFLLNERDRKALDFRWIEGPPGILVLENMLFIGIGSEATNRRGAADFLEWFFAVDTQRQLLIAQTVKQVRTFGIAGGFSSLVAINERWLPQVYPELVGHIPPAETLWFPPSTAPQWNRLRDEAVEPWLQAQVTNSENETLQKVIHDWQLRTGE